MTTKKFNVRVGIVTGNVELDATSGNANVSNVNASGNIVVGTGVTSANLSVTSYLKSNLIPNGNGVLSLANTTNRYKDFYLKGNLDIDGHVISSNVDGIIVGNAFFDGINANSVTINNQLIINSNIESNSTTTGTIVTQGGIGIQQDLTVGGNINLATSSNANPKGVINYNNTADSIDFKFIG